MKSFYLCSVFAALTFGAVSCSQDAPWGVGVDGGQGAIDIKVSALTDVTAAIPAVRAENNELTPPPVNLFQIRLSKKDGSYTKSWSSIQEFAKEESFAVGDYDIEAVYGDDKSQGMASRYDYENAYYKGVSTVTVHEGQTSTVQVIPTLENAIVVVEYTDAFKNYFPEFTTTVQTDGHSPIELWDYSGRLNYVVPGNLSININATMQNGKTLSLNPANFSTEKKHMYKLRFNVANGEVGGVDKLVIEFDESLTEDKVEIDLTDDLVLSPAPVITPVGFQNGETLYAQNSVDFPSELKFNAVARGGIKEAKFTIDSETFKPSYAPTGKATIDLCQAGADVRSAMENDGIKAIGFFTNPDQMGHLDLSGLIGKLPAGRHTFSFEVVDKFTKASEIVSCGVILQDVEMSMAENSTAMFGEGYVDVVVTYNGPDPTVSGNDPFLFRAQTDAEGHSFVECQTMSVTLIPETKSSVFESRKYKYRIALPEINLDSFELRGFWGHELKEMPDIKGNVEFQYPAYTIEFDPMSKKIRLRFSGIDENKYQLFFHKLQVYKDGKKLNEEKVGNKDPEMARIYSLGVIVIYDLEPSTTYSIQTTLQTGTNVTKWGSENSVTTIGAPEIPNGNFSNKTQTINYPNLNSGGQWEVSVWPTHSYYQTKVNYNYSEPDGWASINQKTFYTGSAEKNTWFMVPSTFCEGNSVVIRTVGYCHAGTIPATSGGNYSTKYYNENSPNYDDFTRVSGELFLGSYTFDGKESRVNGIDFIGRPTSLDFNYTYKGQQTSSRGSVHIQLIDREGNVLVQRKMYIYNQESSTHMHLVLPRYPFGKHAAKLNVKFMSSDLEDGIEIETAYPIKDQLKIDSYKLGNFTNHQPTQDEVKAQCIGSVLTISDVKLNYGERQN